MKTIPLNDGRFAIVDDEDYQRFVTHRWRVDGNGYARRNGMAGIVLIHKEILPVGPGQCVDHVNGDKLDNRRANLRPASRRENSRNRRHHRNSSSRFKGVTWHAQTRKWQASIKGDKHVYLGLFECEERAAQAYDAAATELFGAFAVLNFPHDGQPS